MSKKGEFDGNPLWFVDESHELMEYSDEGLASKIFSIVNERTINQQKEIFSAIVKTSPTVAELACGLKKTYRLKLVLSDEVKEKIAKGTYHLMKQKDKDGIFKAVVVDGKGKAKAIADLKWEEIVKGVDPGRLASAMQGMAIQEQLQEVVEQLEDMSASMEEILIGQHNDRLALYYSGEALYREALLTKDEDRKKQLVTMAIMSLTNSICSLQASLVGEIDDVRDKYDKDKDRFIGIKSDKLLDRMILINSAFQTIHKAVALKAAIYYQESEYAALTTVLTDYKSFLERSLSEENAHVLYLADPNEKSIDGTWNIRKSELPQKIDRTRELLVKSSEYSLEVEKEDVI